MREYIEYELIYDDYSAESLPSNKTKVNYTNSHCTLEHETQADYEAMCGEVVTYFV